jgi:hypothetical protein
VLTFRIVEKRKRSKPTIPPFYPLYFWEFAGYPPFGANGDGVATEG